jgi:HEAT repeat protein
LLPAEDKVRFAALLLPALLRALKDPVADVRYKADEALDELPIDRPHLIRVLAGALGDAEPTVRRKACRLPGRAGAAARPALSRLKHLLENSDDAERSDCLWAIQRTAPPTRVPGKQRA